MIQHRAARCIWVHWATNTTRYRDRADQAWIKPGLRALTLGSARREKPLRFLQEPARFLRPRVLQRSDRDLDAPLRFIPVHLHHWAT